MRVLLLSSLSWAATECAAQHPDNGTFVAAMDDAEAAFSDLNLDAFHASLDALGFAVPCLGAPLAPEQAARFHRLQGLRQFLANEENAALRSFQAAQAADPSYRFPTTLVPEGHAILDLYARAATPAPTLPSAPALEGVVYVDGRPQAPMPTSGPALVQVVHQGRVLSTAYHLPGDAPSYALAAEPRFSMAAPERGPILGASALALRRPRFFAGLGIGALALGGWALAAQAQGTYQQPQPTWGEAELRRQERLTNGLTLGAGAASLVSLGLMGSAVMVLRW